MIFAACASPRRVRHAREHRLTPGEEVVITENNQPVAKLGQEVKAI